MLDRDTFAARLGRFSRVRRGLLNAALGYRLGHFALAAGVLGLLLLSGGIPGAITNLAIFGFLVLWVLGLGTTWLIRRVRFPSYLQEAFLLEKLAGHLNSRIVSAWDFLQRQDSQPLEKAVIARAAKDLETAHEAKLDRSGRDRHRMRFSGTLLLLLALGLTPWFGFGLVLENLVRSWRAVQEMLDPVTMTLQPGPGQHVYRLGARVEVAVTLNRQPAREITLVRKYGEEEVRIALTLNGEGRATRTISSDTETEMALRFEIGERRSDEMTLVFTKPPELMNVQTELVYPAYTRQPPRSLEGEQQRLLALPGTRITLGFTFSKELEKATLTWDNRRVDVLEVVGRYATISLLQGEEPKWRQATLDAEDRHGFRLEQPLTIDFERQEDEKPQVLLPRHLKEDMALLEPAAKLFGFGVTASDDYGVTRVVLRWQKSTLDNPTRVTERGEVERLISPALPRAIVNFEKVFEGLELKPGDRLSFQVEAQDNRVPKKQVTLSRRCSFFVFQENLGDLTVRELGFGSGDPLARERIARSTRATAVKEPEGLKTRELVRNEFEGNIASGSQAPTVRGEHAQAIRDYFRLLSGVKAPEMDPKKP